MAIGDIFEWSGCTENVNGVSELFSNDKANLLNHFFMFLVNLLLKTEVTTQKRKSTFFL